MSIYDERLWGLLEAKANEEDEGLAKDCHIANEYLAGVKSLCQFGLDRAATIRDTFPMFTRHDETHICNVLRLMWNLLGEECADKLTRDEAALLVLCACLHDVGMSCSDEERRELLEDVERINQYLEGHPDEFVEAYVDGAVTPQMDDVLVRKYLRAIHPERAADLCYRVEWPVALEGRVDVETVSEVCKSHGNDVSTLGILEPTTTIDVRMCAILLRIADILDFDASRAPRSIYDYCGFNHRSDSESSISRSEWEKHLSSMGFQFDHVEDRSYPYDLPYVATCRSLRIEQAIRGYLDWADSELLGCGKELRYLTVRWQSLILPAKIERHITARGYVSGPYVLTFKQDQILELLAGDDLYTDSAVFVRELIQNAIDAVRTRRELDTDPFRMKHWEPQISIKTWMDDEGYHWFRIEDNGVGMTEEIIRKHLLTVGSSYYASADFEREKIRHRVDPSYTPISRFGIGILSCFGADKHATLVEISTKHFEGHSPSLLLRIDGMSGYYYLANKNEHHKPDPMLGISQSTNGLYRNEPGTVVAVRTNLYLSGMYSGFKEIVDKFVFYPPVPIHYEGDEGCFDYPTEQGFMDAMHSLGELAEEGVNEFSVPEERLRTIRKAWPEFRWDAPPRIQLKVCALDRYAHSEFVSGALVLACVKGELPSFHMCTNGRSVTVHAKIWCKYRDGEVCAGVTFFPKEDHADSSFLADFVDKIEELAQQNVNSPEPVLAEIIRGFVRLDVADGSWRKRQQKNYALTSSELDSKIDQAANIVMSETGLTTDEFATIRYFYGRTRGWKLHSIRVEEIDWYKKWFRSARRGLNHNNPMAHNGIVCGYPRFMFRPDEDNGDCCDVLLLLRDRLRPKLSLSRDEFNEITLETQLVIEGIRRSMARQGFSFGPDIWNRDQEPDVTGYWYLPAGAYDDVLQDQPRLVDCLSVKLDGPKSSELLNVKELSGVLCGSESLALAEMPKHLRSTIEDPLVVRIIGFVCRTCSVNMH